MATDLSNAPAPKHGNHATSQPSDKSNTVLPIHLLDDTLINRGLTLCWTLRFNDVLSAEKIRDALQTLLTIGDWKKLGSRIRLDKQTNKLELHLPSEFTEDHPAIGFSHTSYNSSIDDHPLGSQLPKPTHTPSIHQGPSFFRELCARPDAPCQLSDYLESDEPGISLHVASFTDATLVSFNWLHVLADAVGFKDLMSALCLVLAGKEEQVPPLGGVLDDPLAPFDSDSPKEPYVLGDMELKGLKGLVFGIRFVADMFLGPKCVSRILYLPSSFVDSLRVRGTADLSSTNSTVKLSTNDLLVAWLTGLIFRRSKNRNIILKNVVEVRTRLTDVLDSATSYVQNMYLGAYVLSRADEFASGPLGPGALIIQKSIQDQTTPTQVRAQLHLTRQSARKYMNPPIFGRPWSKLISFTNWSRAQFFDLIDFSPAIVGGGKNGDTGATAIAPGPMRGKVTYMHCDFRGLASRYLVPIMGKDQQGGYWIGGYLPQKVWDDIEVEMSAAREPEKNVAGSSRSSD